MAHPGSRSHATQCQLRGVGLGGVTIAVALAIPRLTQPGGGQAAERREDSGARNQADLVTVSRPQVTPLPKKIRVLLRSDPPGATVHHKGKAEELGDTGTTGLPLELDPGQTLELTISKSAYLPVPISLGPGDAPLRIVKLELAPP